MGQRLSKEEGEIREILCRCAFKSFIQGWDTENTIEDITCLGNLKDEMFSFPNSNTAVSRKKKAYSLAAGLQDSSVYMCIRVYNILYLDCIFITLTFPIFTYLAE